MTRVCDTCRFWQGYYNNGSRRDGHDDGFAFCGQDDSKVRPTVYAEHYTRWRASLQTHETFGCTQWEPAPWRLLVSDLDPGDALDA